MSASTMGLRMLRGSAPILYRPQRAGGPWVRSLATGRQRQDPTKIEETLVTAPTRSTHATLDFSPAELDHVMSRTGAKSARDSLSSIERRRKRMGWLASASLLVSLVGGYIYLGWEPDEKLDAGRGKVSAWIARSNHRTLHIFDYFNKPIWNELLPPPLPPGYQKPYTLILSIDDLLVASVWDRQNGWRTAKRPGVDYFLGYLSQHFEIVVFTTQSAMTAGPIMDKLDPWQYNVLYSLFRESTRSTNGKIVKDLAYLNRDLSKVIAIDTVAERYSEQPSNAIIVPKWKGDRNDTGLIGLIPFLESIAFLQPPDVRPIVKAYHGKDIPSEYAKIEATNKKRFMEEWERKQKSAAGLGSGGFTLSKLFTPQSAPTPPMTYLEQRRKFAQQAYLEEQKYFRDNHELLKKQKEEALEAQMKEMMAGGIWSAMNRMFSGPPPPPTPPNPTSAQASEMGPVPKP